MVNTAFASSLVSRWDGDVHLEETVIDVQNGNNGSFINGATTNFGMIGQAFSFDGIDDEVNINDTESLDLGAQFTIEAWFKTDNVNKIDTGTGEEKQSIVTYGFSDQDGKNNGLSINNGVLTFFIRGTTSPQFDDLIGTTSIMSNIWYHAALSYDGQTANLYLNGILEDSRDVSMNMNANSRIIIGRYQNPRYFNINFAFDGLIDEVEILNHALTSTEIQSIYNAGVAKQ